ncbi:MAG: hypothetical protein KDA25_09585, partial [Phycisphaerales bacterium]|nr:hypothetical protein [Phycisphaerales bacterium]
AAAPDAQSGDRAGHAHRDARNRGWTMQYVIAIVGGVVVVIVVYVIIRIWDWWTTIRQIAAQPPEIHVLAGANASTLVFLYRKPARSWNFRPVPGDRAVTLSGGRSIFTIPGGTTITAHDGLAIATVLGVTPGNATLTIKAASGQPDREYGPTEVPVHVYSNASNLPAGAVLTPQIQVIVGSAASEDG